MTDPSGPQSGAGIDVQVFCELSDASLQGFKALINELLEFLPAEAAPFLASIFILPANQMEDGVNALIGSAEQPEKYSQGKHTPGYGVAVPVEKDGMLACFILLNKDILQPLTPEHYHEFDAVSTILEEILHVRMYSITWKRRGYLLPIDPDACKRSLWAKCEQAHDEYVVGRWKASLAASISMFDHQGEIITGEISYGTSITYMLDEGYAVLTETVRMAVEQTLSIQDAWPRLINEIYRYILEPLARDAGFRAGNPSGSHPHSNASSSWFYQEKVMSYWIKIEEQLGLAFDSDFAQSDSALEEIVSLISSFLQEIGAPTRMRGIQDVGPISC